MDKRRDAVMTLAKESWILIAICIIDLISTLFLLDTKTASEGNPIMGFYLKFGIGTFVMVKITLLVLPIFIFEWCRQYRPDFVRLMLRTAIIAYVGAYLLLFVAINTEIREARSWLSPRIQALRTIQLD